ncbi:uncharacterized protein LOC110652485 isoform X2 [Hevea brasiliensis]|uniref:uncharacterized protein LOC110652485 isoform X2 n=1 Tax=Hevea brasiliensis TaxID=3981 RepID=UPI0025F2D1AB|nr:uncharacterized protein LOC110652485 isoform X2 [Hevea brasiliensis]
MLPEPAVAHAARAGGKFQPRAKSQARKVTSTSFPSVLPSNAREKSVSSFPTTFDTTKPVQSVHPVDDRGGSLVSSSGLPGSEEHLEDNDNNLKCEPVKSSTQTVERREDLASPDALPSEFVVTNSNKNGDSNLLIREADPLGLDLDPFAVIFPNTTLSKVRAGGKFQPRGKAWPRKGTSELNAFSVSGATVGGHASVVSTVSDNLQSAKFIDVGDCRLMDSVYSSLTTLESMESKEALRNDDCTNSGVLLFNVERSSGLANSSHLVASDALHSRVIDRDSHSGLGKSTGESADIFSGLEYILDFVTQSPRSTEEHSRFPALISVSSSLLSAGSEATQNPVTCNEPAVQTDNGKLKSDEPGSFPNLESPGILPPSAIALECCTRKIQPKTVLQNGQEKPSTSILPDAVESIVPLSNAQIDPSETVYIDEGTIPTFPSEDVLDNSSMSFSNFIPTDPTTSEFPMNEEQINLAEASCSGDVNILHQEDVPGVPVKESSKDRKRKSASVSNLAQNSKQYSLVGEMNESGKSARQLRKRIAAPQLVDGLEDEAHDTDGFPPESPSNSIADEGHIDYDYGVDEDRVENASSNKRASKKSKKPSAEQEKKPVSRCKRDNGAPEQSNQQSHKKFSHSTRQKNRLKDLLSIPEDEIDFQKMPLKDIILLAGYKEKLARHKLQRMPQPIKALTILSFGEDSHNKEDTITSEQDGGCAENQSNSLFNYHSFMDKTPTARWSKPETELFYEGIWQFGTDLSMIQQLFPGRTRHQIKLKFKKEERQHPLRLSEALSSRAKDHSYFEKVIEQLQQVAALAEQESNRGNSVSLTDEEAELNPETNEEVAKSD